MYYDYCYATHVKSLFQKIAKNSNFNRNITFFVFTILFDKFTRYLIFELIFFSVVLSSELHKRHSYLTCFFYLI